MNKLNQNHPIWRFLDMVILLIVIWICSASTANNFDETEIKLIGMVLFAMGGYTAIKAKAAKESKDKDK